MGLPNRLWVVRNGGALQYYGPGLWRMDIYNSGTIAGVRDYKDTSA
jgi:hypothetical protein